MLSVVLGAIVARAADPDQEPVTTDRIGENISTVAVMPDLATPDIATDRRKPVLRFFPVPHRTALTNGELQVTGTARDNVGIAGVFVRLNRAAWQSAETVDGWAHWELSVSLRGGTNRVEAYAVDTDGNISRTNLMRLIFTPAPSSLAGFSLNVTRPDLTTVKFSFAEQTFSEPMGVGQYVYQKTGDASGRLLCAYTAPPSATNENSSVGILLDFLSLTNGTFVNAEGTNTFYLEPAGNGMTNILSSADLICDYDQADEQAVFGFVTPPRVSSANLVGKLSSTDLRNPFKLQLIQPYPGAIGDRVLVPIIHYKGSKKYLTNFPGTVVSLTNSSIKIWFDPHPTSNGNNTYELKIKAPLPIQNCSDETYMGGSLIQSNRVAFRFNSMSPDTGLFVVTWGDVERFLVLTSADNPGSGTFYEEDYQGGSLTTNRTGVFMLFPDGS